MTNNIAQTNQASTDGSPIYAEVIGGGIDWPSLTDTGNFFNGIATVCRINGTCNSGSAPFSASSFGLPPLSITGDTYTTPSYTNTTDLLTNRVGVPNCTGFINTTQCMGYDAATSTLTVPSVISDLTQLRAAPAARAISVLA